MNDCKYFKAKGIDYKGQLQKISKSNAKLQPIYEALTNSIEATKLLSDIDKKQIKINLYFDNGLFSDTTQEYSISKIVIEDYGIGFNDKEFDRFTKLHDNSKGFKNQGSGRIQYMHFFNITKFESTYRDTNSKTDFYKREFWLSKSDAFIGNDAIICFKEPVEEQTNESKTIIEFKDFLDEEDKKYFSLLTPESLKATIIEHYLYYFCENRDNLPEIHITSFVNYQKNKVTVITHKDIPQENKHEEIKIKYKTLDEDNGLIQIDEEETFHIKAFKLNKDLLHSNDLKLTSKHEIVRGKFDKKFELNILKSDDIIDSNRYLFLVSSDYIDKRDTDNRGELKIYITNEEFKNDSSLFKETKVISIDDIQSEVNSHILTMYSEILENKQKHALDIEALQQMFLLDKNTLKQIQINVQDTDEDILKKVYRADAKRVATNDAKLKEEIEQVNQELNDMNPTAEGYKEQLNRKVSSLVKKIPLQNKVELTHSVARRKLVLELFSKILDKELSIQDESNRNIDEELLHNLIFKQSSNNPELSDLWLVNEDFIYFKGTSEEQLGQIKIDNEIMLKDYDALSQEEKEFRNSLNENRYSKRPDILLFPDEGKCIILEFKNPEVSISSHLQQIQNYATLILNFSKDKFQFHTFYGYFIGEKINPLDVRSHNPNFVESYHFDYLFKPSETVAGFFGRRDANIYTEVIKYSTLLKRAKKRNEFFISKLGVS